MSIKTFGSGVKWKGRSGYRKQTYFFRPYVNIEGGVMGSIPLMVSTAGYSMMIVSVKHTRTINWYSHCTHTVEPVNSDHWSVKRGGRY